MRMRGSLLIVALATLVDVASPLKILCLHGGGGDGPSFQSDPGMVALESSLGSTFEFVYASGPYAGGLWIMDPPGGKNQPTTDPNWASQSVAVLDNLVATQGPFHGLLGYSQGTAMALTYLASAPTSTFEVVILFCGYIPTTHTGLANSISAASPFGGINALVWMGANDFIITNAQSQEAATKFTSPTIIVSQSGDHAVPTSSDSTFSNVVSFISASVTSTSPSSSPSPSPSPSPSVSYISTAFEASGDVSSYSAADTQAIAQVFATQAGVALSAVDVAVAGGSVTISVTIAVPSATATTTANSLSSGILASPTALQSALQSGGASSVTVSTITASVTVSATDPNAATTSSDEPCFPSDATVTKADGTVSRVDALEEGDAILSATMEGALTTGTVSLLSLAKREARAAFLTLTTATNHTLTLTPEHHLPTGATCCSSLRKAKNVHVGETIWVVEDGEVTATVVTTVSKAHGEGLYSPVLTSGSFPVVDGVVTSFDSIEKVTLAKYGLASLLAACKASGTCAIFRELFFAGDRSYIVSLKE